MKDNHDPKSLMAHLLDRRRLLVDASILTGGVATATLFGTDTTLASNARAERRVLRMNQATPVASPGATPVSELAVYTPNHLTEAELTTLKAALDRIIPADDLGPGANEMGVFVYIDKSLGGMHADSLPLYQTGLAALDTAAGSGGFAELSADKQDAMLTDAESGKLAGTPTGFFGTLLAHTREGMFSDPIYGGNVNFQGWDMVGFPGIKLEWSAEDQAAGSTPAPQHISVAKYREAQS